MSCLRCGHTSKAPSGKYTSICGKCGSLGVICQDCRKISILQNKEDWVSDQKRQSLKTGKYITTCRPCCRDNLIQGILD